ncbi:MAG: hypothetical protein K6F69_06710 [Treponema sp.]|nr:hypothetical protein [Treponema sp.]
MIYFKFRHNVQKDVIEKEESVPKWNQISFWDIVFLPLCFFLCFCEKISSLTRSYNPKLENVDVWYVEYDEDEYNVVMREIGIDVNGNVVWKAPWKDFLGLWTDEDFNIDFYRERFGFEMISKEEFEELWNSYPEIPK